MIRASKLLQAAMHHQATAMAPQQVDWAPALEPASMAASRTSLLSWKVLLTLWHDNVLSSHQETMSVPQSWALTSLVSGDDRWEFC